MQSDQTLKDDVTQYYERRLSQYDPISFDAATERKTPTLPMVAAAACLALVFSLFLSSPSDEAELAIELTKTTYWQSDTDALLRYSSRRFMQSLPE